MIDPTYELLFRKVAEAYAQVDSNAQRTVEFEHDKYRVQVYHPQPGTYGPQPIHIAIWDDVPVKPPTLISP